MYFEWKLLTEPRIGFFLSRPSCMAGLGLPDYLNHFVHLFMRCMEPMYMRHDLSD